MMKKDFHTFIHTWIARDAVHEHRSKWRLQMAVYDPHVHGNCRSVQSMLDNLTSQQCLKRPIDVSSTKEKWRTHSFIISNLHLYSEYIVMHIAGMQHFYTYSVAWISTSNTDKHIFLKTHQAKNGLILLQRLKYAPCN